MGIERSTAFEPERKAQKAHRPSEKKANVENEPITVDEDGYLPWESESMKIELLKIEWKPSSYGQTADPIHYDLVCLDDSPFDIKFQIDLSISGIEIIQAGGLELVLPAYLWKTRPERNESGEIISEGEEAGILTISVPEQPDQGADFAWTRLNDNIVITNTHAMSGATRALIQGSFRRALPHTMEDGTDSRDYTTFNVTAVLSDALGNELTRTGNMSEKQVNNGGVTSTEYEHTPIYATIDTFAAADYISKSAEIPNVTNEYYVYYSVPESLPESLRPATPGNYVYVRWSVTAKAYGTQPFLMKFTDTLSDTDYNTYGGRILGAEGLIREYNNGLSVKAAEGDGRSIEGVFYDGYNTYDKSCKIWVAYPKDKFEEGTTYTINNSVELTVEGYDDWLGKTREEVDGTISKTAAAQGEAILRFPTTYHVTKIWDDNDNEEGRRPSSLKVFIYADGYYWGRGILREANNWTYSWNDGGHPHVFTVSEEGLPKGEYFEDHDDENYRLWVWWKYELRNKVWDEDTNTWTITNKFVKKTEIIGRIWYHTPETYINISKKAVGLTNTNKKATTDSLLNALRRGDTAEISYDVSGVGRFLDYTYGDGYDSIHLIENEQYDYAGQRPARFEVIDEHLYFYDSEKESGIKELDLDPEDYCISKVVPELPTLLTYIQSDKYLPWEWTANEELSRQAEIFLLGRSINSDGEFGEWVTYASFKNGSLTAMNGASVLGDALILPDGVHQVKQQVDTKAHGARLGFRVYVKLNPTEHLLNDIVEPAFDRDESDMYIMLRLSNTTRAVISDPEDDNREKIENGAIGNAYLHGRDYRNAATLDKEYDILNDGKPYDDSDMTAPIVFSNTVTLKLQSNVFNKNEYLELLETGVLANPKGGTYYDLLPPGVQPVLSSIGIDESKENDRVLEAYVIENYRNSGRTMLVVKVSFDEHISGNADASYDYNKYAEYSDNYPSVGYKSVHKLHYTSIYPRSELINRLTQDGVPPLVNSVAFESDETFIGTILNWSGENDKADYEDAADYANCRTRYELTSYAGYDDRALMTDLDPDADYPNFVYAGAMVDLTGIDIFGVYNSSKDASIDGNKWGSGITDLDPTAAITAYEGGTYIYRISMWPDENTRISGVQFFDPLEVFYPASTIPGYDNNGSWKGVIESVDVSQMRALGIDPKVYYYVGGLTIDGVDIGNMEDCFERIDVSDSSVWKTELPADRTTVTAVYVDARIDKEGHEYTLPENQRVSVDIHMRAPIGEEPFSNSDDIMDAEKNAHAFNRAITSGYLVKDGGEGEERTNSTQFTKVGILPFSVKIEKEWDDLDDNDRLRPGSITVDLYGDGELVGTVDISAADNWEARFDHVRRFNDDSTPVRYTVVEHAITDGEYTSESETVSSENGELVIKLTNKHKPITTEVPFSKEWDTSLAGDDSDARPDYIVVDLYRWVWNAEPDAETGERTGKWQFTNERRIVRPDESGNWHGVFSGDTIYKYDQGEEITYTVREVPVYKYITTYDETEPNNPKIKNTYWPYGDLVITKTVENATDIARERGIFKFTLLLTYEGKGLSELYPYEKYNEGETEPFETGNIGNGSEFTLKDGQRIEIKNIMSEAEYEVVETPAAGYTVKSSGGSTGAIVAGETQRAEFINLYGSKAGADITFTKVMKGHALFHNQFSFSLIDSITGEVIATTYAPTTAYDPATHIATATVTFPRLYYTEADNGKTYSYIIKENVPDEYPDGYTVFDGSEYTYTITLTDNGNGTMTKTEAYGGTESASTPPTFVNEYHASGELELKAWKTLKGGTLEDYIDVFEFEIVKPDGTPVVTARTNSEGTIVFPAIPYTEQDAGNTYLYVVREINTGDERVNYAENAFGYNVRVFDGNNGTILTRINLTAVELRDGVYVAVEGDVDPLFENTLKPGSLSITKEGTWPEGQEPENKEFTFHIEFFGEIMPDTIQMEKTFDDVITVGIGGLYMTLQEAFDAAKNGDRIVLVSDLDHYEQATLGGKKVTLDLQDHTIYNSSSEYAVRIDEGGSLTLENGTWIGGSLFSSYGELVINSGEYRPDDVLFFAAHEYIESSINSVEINGGNFKGGSVYADYWEEYVEDEWGNGDYYEHYEVNFACLGGQFDGVNFDLSDAPQPSAFGGSYTDYPPTPIPKGYKVVTGVDTIQDYDGTVYTVVPDPDATMVAEVVETGVQFGALEDAVRFAKNGQTVKLLANAVTSEAITIRGKSISIDLDGKTVTLNNSIVLRYAGLLNITGGGTWDVRSSDYGFGIENNGKLKVESGSFTCPSSGSGNLFRLKDGELEITGGEFTWNSKSIIDDSDLNWRYYSQHEMSSEIKGGKFISGAIKLDYPSLKVTGGTFMSGVTACGPLFIKGGLWAFSLDFESLCPKYKAVESSQTIEGNDGQTYEIVFDPDAEAVAEDENGNLFYSFADIIYNAESRRHVTMLKNTASSYPSILFSKEVYLDLAGHEVEIENGIVLKSSATLTLSDTAGTGKWVVKEYFLIKEDSEICVNSGVFENSSILFLLDSGRISISNGTFRGGSYIIDTTITDDMWTDTAESRELIINGGTFSDAEFLIYFWVQEYEDAVSITGGYFENGGIIYENGRIDDNMCITGGVFSDVLPLATQGTTPYIAGGIWSILPDSCFMCEGFMGVEITDGEYAGWYEVIEPEPVAEDDYGNAFYSIDDVFENSEYGSCITSCTDITLSQMYYIDSKELTLDFGSHNVNVGQGGGISIGSSAYVSINGGNWNVSSDYEGDVFAVNCDAALNVESGSFSGGASGSTLFNLQDGYLNINGGSFTWNGYAVFAYGAYALQILDGSFTNPGGETIIYWDSPNDYYSEISGGTFTGGGIEARGEGLLITGGTFSDITPDGVQFIQGGRWNSEPDSSYICDEYIAVSQSDGWYEVVYDDGTYNTGSIPVGRGRLSYSFVGAPGRLLAAPIMIMAPLDTPSGESVEIIDNTVTFTIQAGQTVTFNELPASVNYRIWEETPEGWTLVSATGETGTIKPLEKNEAKFTNNFDAGSTSVTLSGKKYLDGALSGQSFSFTVHQVSGPETVADRMVTSTAGGVIPIGTYVYTQTGDYVYEITENAAGEQYVKDNHVETVRVEVRLIGTTLKATVIYDSDGAVFNNYTKPGEITITKSVDPEVTVDYSGKLFTFKVTLTDNSGMAISSGSVYVELPGGTRADLENGTVTFHIKAGETATVKNVPAGARYEVEETNLTDGWNLKQWSGPNAGTMTALGSVSVTAVNTYVPERVISGFASITAHKRYEGAELNSGAFAFELHSLESAGAELTETTRIQSKTNSAVDMAEVIAGVGGAETANPWYGTAPVRFDDIVYTEQGTYYYAIREIAGTDTKIDYDGHTEYVTVNVDLVDGRLTAEVEYDSDGAVFENRLKTGGLRVEKTLRNATELASAKEFTFTVTLENRDGVELTGTYAVTIGSLDTENTETRSTTVTSGGTVAIKGGEYFEIDGLPHEAKYEITETQLAGFDRTEVNGEEGLTAESTITAGATSTERYLNYYSTTGTLNDRVNPVIRKTFHGGEIAPNQFKFELYEVATDGSESYVETAYANTDGTIFFAAFDFTNEDDGKTYVYRVYEIEDEGENEILFDSEPITLTIRISDNGAGKLTAEVEKDREAFENYRVYAFTVTKAVSGNAAADAEYGFAVKFTKDGDVFAPFNIPEDWEKQTDGSYRFKLKNGESKGVSLPAGVQYELVEDEIEYCEVSYEIPNINGVTPVTGNGRRVERTITDEFGSENVTVTNTFTAGTLTISKTVSGNMGNKAQAFRFTLRLTDYELGELPEGWTYENGEYSFTLTHGDSVTIVLPVGTAFEIEEEDIGEYTVTATVNGGEPTEIRAVTGTVTAENSEITVAYRNYYEVSVPTGIEMPFGGAMLLIPALAIAAFILRKRKERKE